MLRLPVLQKLITIYLFPDIEAQLEGLNREQGGKQSDLEEWKNKEREFGDKISDDAKMLEKMTNKQSLLLKKVKQEMLVWESMIMWFVTV